MSFGGFLLNENEYRTSTKVNIYLIINKKNIDF